MLDGIVEKNGCVDVNDFLERSSLSFIFVYKESFW